MNVIFFNIMIMKLINNNINAIYDNSEKTMSYPHHRTLWNTTINILHFHSYGERLQEAYFAENIDKV